MKNLSFFAGLTLVLVGSARPTQAQSPYVQEALNYSRLQFGGPARTQGIAGANVALGADFGNLSSNPAGLGLFQKSEAHFAPGLGLGTADANGLTADNNSFHVGSAGVVFTNRRADEDSGNGNGWRGGSFAVGFTRLADFNSTFTYSGQVTDDRSFFQRLREPDGNTNINSAAYQSAVTDILTQDNGGRNSVYTSLDGLAYGAYLTDIDDSRGTRRSEVFTRLRSGAITQGETVTTAGSLSQLDFGYGASYQDRLYVGGALGVVSSNRRQERSFTEKENEAGTRFASLRLDDAVRSTGAGFNLRAGLIYRLTDAVRLGAAVQSPTFLRLTETGQTTTLSSTFTPFAQDPDPITGATVSLQPAADYTYRLTTPLRASGGVAVTLGKAGFVSGDVEYVGYQQARLGSTDPTRYKDASAIADDNQLINSAYQSTVNLRLGAEGRFDVFRLRAGFAHYGDPYRGGSSRRAQQFYTVGAGVRQPGFFIDLAGVYGTRDQQYSPYSLAGGQQPVINVQNSRFTTTLTAGLTF